MPTKRKSLCDRYPKTLLEMLSAVTILRMLGFDVESELKLVFSDDLLAVQVIRGPRSLLIEIGRPELPLPSMVHLWGQLTNAWSSNTLISYTEKEEVVIGSSVYSRSEEIIDMLIRGGVTITYENDSKSVNLH